jgi:diguanylate cyclase (GGDEF)-like protein
MKRESILIVDREEDTRYILSLLVERMGYGFRATPDLREGFNLLEKEPFSLVILEIIHLHAKHTVKMRRLHPNMGIIFTAPLLEGLPENTTPDLLDFLPKPINPEEAGFRIKRILLERSTRTKHGEAEQALRTAREELERKKRELESSMEDLEHIKRLYKEIGKELNTTSEKLREANDKLELIAITDGLTEVFNHRYLMEQIHERFSEARQQMTPLSLLMIDIDHFKAFNDNHGHMTGDLVLKEIACILKSNCRPGDIVARYGGEEFAVILPRTDSQKAVIVAEKIRGAVENHELSDGEPAQGVTVSIGVSTRGNDAATVNDLISSADKALYQAKSLGRNRVERPIISRDFRRPSFIDSENPITVTE